MRPGAWAIAVAWLAVAAALAVRGAILGARAGRAPAIFARLKSPTVYLFAGYLIIAALVSPRSTDETSSPLYGLAIALPLAWAAATCAASSVAARAWPSAVALFLLYGGAVLTSGAIVLAVTSPAFVPPWLR